LISLYLFVAHSHKDKDHRTTRLIYSFTSEISPFAFRPSSGIVAPVIILNNLIPQLGIIALGIPETLSPRLTGMTTTGFATQRLNTNLILNPYYGTISQPALLSQRKRCDSLNISL